MGQIHYVLNIVEVDPIIILGYIVSIVVLALGILYGVYKEVKGE